MRYPLWLASMKAKLMPFRAAAVTLAVSAVVLSLGPAALPVSSLSRLDEIERTVKQIETRLAAPGLSRTDSATPTTLLVAIQFVTAAAERSAPFDTALAVAISMAGEHPRVGPLLDALLSEATAGVSSREDLRAEFQAQIAEFEKEGLLTGSGGPIGEPAFRLSRFLGFAASELSAEHRAVMQQLSADITNQNFARAVQLVAKLDGRLREGLESWRVKAERRASIDSILTELRRAALVDIIEEAS